MQGSLPRGGRRSSASATGARRLSVEAQGAMATAVAAQAAKAAQATQAAQAAQGLSRGGREGATLLDWSGCDRDRWQAVHAEQVLALTQLLDFSPQGENASGFDGHAAAAALGQRHAEEKVCS